ncbi:hypothetical protein F4781DRAFT_431504 [Annulohypoxylon bovei var. microspora]|nr:hypothetical protein F4781DRAFT_431504 [Annulohypoxylon bovei var. microspora]
MYSKSITALLIAALFSHPTTQFSCHTREKWGFSPVCCTHIEGQVGINCVTAHQLGITNPSWECNLYVYNITGCCQLTGYRNPYTNNTIEVCATQIDP